MAEGRGPGTPSEAIPPHLYPFEPLLWVLPSYLGTDTNSVVSEGATPPLVQRQGN